MGCIGCFNDFGGPWDIIDDLDDVEIDGDRLPFRRPAPRHGRDASPVAFYFLTICVFALDKYPSLF